jgi:hypothetical protein
MAYAITKAHQLGVPHLSELRSAQGSLTAVNSSLATLQTSFTALVTSGAVLTTGNQTIAGEKTLEDTTRVFAVMVGARKDFRTRGAGSSQPSISDSDTVIRTDGDITIPNDPGFHCWLEMGGDHIITFNGQTHDPSAVSNDIFYVYVRTASVIRLVPMGASITQADFS